MPNSAPWGGDEHRARVRRADTIRPVSGGGGDTPPGRCGCPMMAAARAGRRGKFRLARRYAAWSIRLMAAQLA